MSTLGTIILGICTTILGFVVQLAYSSIKRKLTNKRELNDNDNIDVTDDWFAVWQTTINKKETINIEPTKMIQKGKTVKFYNTERAMDNPKGGYLWESEMHFYHGRTLMGWYFPKKEENNSSKGIMYLSYSSQRKIFLGKWVGTGYDGDLVSGLVAIAKNKDKADKLLRKLSSHFPNYPTDIIFNNLYQIDDDE